MTESVITRDDGAAARVCWLHASYAIACHGSCSSCTSFCIVNPSTLIPCPHSTWTGVSWPCPAVIACLQCSPCFLGTHIYRAPLPMVFALSPRCNSSLSSFHRARHPAGPSPGPSQWTGTWPASHCRVQPRIKYPTPLQQPSQQAPTRPPAVQALQAMARPKHAPTPSVLHQAQLRLLVLLLVLPLVLLVQRPQWFCQCGKHRSGCCVPPMRRPSCCRPWQRC